MKLQTEFYRLAKQAFGPKLKQAFGRLVRRLRSEQLCAYLK